MTDAGKTYTAMCADGSVRDLPYALYYGHCGMTASERVSEWGKTGRVLAQVAFPCGSSGPFDPPDVRNKCFAELDDAARAALAA